MAQILLTDLFSLQVKAFRASANDLDAPSYFSINEEGLSLPTVDAYHERISRIWRIMVWSGAVIKKDADDLDALADRLRAADNSGS